MMANESEFFFCSHPPEEITTMRTVVWKEPFDMGICLSI